MRTAEAVKLTENIFRSVNIALSNELKVIFERMDIDVFRVIDAAATKPFGFMPFYPGPGVGGHCIPVDPFYLTWKAREYGLHTRFVELAGEINSAMPQRVVDRLVEALSDRLKLAVNGAKILDRRPRLQEERRRHPREPVDHPHRTSESARRRCRLPRPLRARVPDRPATMPRFGGHAFSGLDGADAVRPSTRRSSRRTMTGWIWRCWQKSVPLVVDTRDAMRGAAAGVRGEGWCGGEGTSPIHVEAC